MLILPRQTGTGPLHDATCIFRSTCEEPLLLTLESAPRGFFVEINGDDYATFRVVRVMCDPRRVDDARGRQQIRFRAKAGPHESLLDLPVILNKQ